MSFDDLYNNFKIVEQEVKGTTSLSSQNVAFVSSSSNTNEVNTAYGVSTANTQVSPASTQVSTTSTQVSTANLNYYSEDQYAVSIKEDTAYPCLHSPKTTEDKAQYAVSRETQYAVFKIWNEYNILEDIKRGPYSKKSPIRRIQLLGYAMQTNGGKVDTSKALDAILVGTKSNGTESKKQDECSSSGNDIDAVDADIRPIYDEEPMVEVQLTSECNIFANDE
ncbi:hypothetical protein Tco_1403377 [Tanacetum coccineum]